MKSKKDQISKGTTRFGLALLMICIIGLIVVAVTFVWSFYKVSNTSSKVQNIASRSAVTSGAIETEENSDIAKAVYEEGDEIRKYPYDTISVPVDNIGYDKETDMVIVFLKSDNVYFKVPFEACKRAFNDVNHLCFFPDTGDFILSINDKTSKKIHKKRLKGAELIE